MNSKEKYNRLCETEHGIPVFSHPWFLDAVCSEGRWDVVCIESNDKIQAVLPFYMPRPGVIGMPQFTQVLGPWIRTADGKYEAELTRQKKLLGQLIEALPEVRKIRMDCDSSLTNWLPFYWAGYNQTTRYTYRIDDLTDISTLWDGLNAKYRNTIRKSQKKGIRIESRDDVEILSELLDKSYQRQGLRYPNSYTLLRKIHKAAVDNDAGKIFVAVDDSGKIHAASFLVWNSSCAYYLASGADPELRASGGQTHLLWALVEFASKTCKSFDFEGSMVEEIEKVFRGFGAKQVPYFSLSRDTRSTMVRWLDTIEERVNGLKARFVKLS